MNASWRITPAASQWAITVAASARSSVSRLLAEDVFAGVGGLHRPLRVEVVGQRVVHRVDARRRRATPRTTRTTVRSRGRRRPPERRRRRRDAIATTVPCSLALDRRDHGRPADLGGAEDAPPQGLPMVSSGGHGRRAPVRSAPQRSASASTTSSWSWRCGKSGDRCRADDADAVDDDREAPAVGGHVTIVQAHLCEHRAPVTSGLQPDGVRRAVQQLDHVPLPAGPVGVCRRSAVHRVQEDRCACEAYLDRHRDIEFDGAPPKIASRAPMRCLRRTVRSGVAGVVRRCSRDRRSWRHRSQRRRTGDGRRLDGYSRQSVESSREWRMDSNPIIELLGRRLRLAVIGGGPGSFIGAMHRTAARLDDRYEIVAGVLSSDPERSQAAGVALGHRPGPGYTATRSRCSTPKPNGSTVPTSWRS